MAVELNKQGQYRINIQLSAIQLGYLMGVMSLASADNKKMPLHTSTHEILQNEALKIYQKEGMIEKNK